MKTQNRINFFGVPIDQLTLSGLLERVVVMLQSSGTSKIMYVNVHCMNLALSYAKLHRILTQADLVYCDGAGIVLGARLHGLFLSGRMTGADWIYDLCALCEKKKYSVFFLGAEPGIAQKAISKLKKEYPGLNVAGSHHGYFTEQEDDALINKINKSKADILLVGMGSPLQEYWIDKYFAELNIPLVWAMGAVMDYIAGKVPRAPQWMLNNGLEWVYRFIVEPKRMWRRYLIGNVSFLLNVIAGRRTCKTHENNTM